MLTMIPDDVIFEEFMIPVGMFDIRVVIV